MTKSKMPGHEGKTIRYRIIDTSTETGEKEFKESIENGWKIGSLGLNTVNLYKLEE